MRRRFVFGSLYSVSGVWHAIGCVVLVGAAFLLINGCGKTMETDGVSVTVGKSPKTSASVNGFPRTIIDGRGKTLTLAATPQHIVSVAPSNTESLFAIGAGDRIAGDTTACDYPPEAKTKPHIGSSGTMSAESVLAVHPDLVVADGVINGRMIDALDRLHTVPVLVVKPKTVSEAYDSLLLLGQATGQDAKTQAVVSDMKARIEAVRQTTAKATSRPKVLIMYGDSPIYTTGPGSFIDDLITVAGGTNIVSAPLPNGIISGEEVLTRKPDVIICSKELAERARRLPGWAASVPAVRDNRFFDASDQATLIQATPRLAQGAEELARFLHPDLFPAKPSP